MVEETYWAVHAFEAENPDEISFQPGEPIVILEKDDQYGDGWWQGRNMRGDVGLFPKDYTAPIKPIMPTSQPLASNGSQTSTVEARSTSDASERGPVLAATMTDIQKAIEQQPALTNGSAKGSSLSRDDASSVHLDDDEPQSPGDAWSHANARSLLAANARDQLDRQAAAEREAEEQRRLDEERFRAAGDPPIDGLELSDESDDEGNQYVRRGSRGSEDIGRAIYEQSTPRPPYAGDSDDDGPPQELVMPEEPEPQLRSAAFYGRAASPQPRSSEAAAFRKGVSPNRSTTSLGRKSMDDSLSAPMGLPSRFSAATATSAGVSEALSTRRSSASSLSPAVPPVPQLQSARLSPALDPEQHVETLQTRSPVTMDSPQPTFPPTTPLSVASTSSRPHSRTGTGPGSTSATTVDQSPRSSLVVKQSMGSLTAPPNTWTVEQVVEWGRTRGFDALTLSKFQEHEISGDVLLELDVATLKEIDLPAFGRRVQIYNAIKELKKSMEPPAAPAPQLAQQPLVSPTLSGYEPDTPSSRNFSPRDSFSPQETRNSFGTAISSNAGDTKRVSDASSFAAAHGGNRYGGAASVIAPALAASLPYGTSASRGSHGRHESDPSAALGANARTFEPLMHGLGLNEPAASTMGRSQSAHTGYERTPPATTPLAQPPANLKRTETDGTLETFHSAGEQGLDDVMEEGAEAPDPLKEGNKQTKLRRRTDSNPSMSSPKAIRTTKLGDDATADKGRSAPSSPEVSRFGSIRSNKGERSSSFFPASLRGRKPAPKAPSATSESDKEGKTKRSTRLFTFGSSPAASSSPTMAGNTDAAKSIISPPLESNAGFVPGAHAASKSKSSTGSSSPQVKQHSRTASAATTQSKSGARPISTAAPAKAAGVAAPVEGQDIMQKIGTPDLVGWLRKKSERYNTWKTRYMILKGRHLYAMKSASETRVKGWIDLAGYKVLPDADSARGHYGFKLHHSSKPPHFFSSEDPVLIRKFMKALMKGSITRDYTAPVLSSNNIQTITLAEAQAMFPPPRPPSPTSRARAQKLRLADSNPNTLSPKDAEILMSLQKPGVPIAPPRSGSRAKRDSKASSMIFGGNGNVTPGLESPSTLFTSTSSLPPSPTTASRRSPSTARRSTSPPPRLPPVQTVMSPKRDADADLLEWVNDTLPLGTPKATDFSTSWRSTQLILRLAETLSGRKKAKLDDARFAELVPDSEDELDVGFDVYDFLTLDLGIDTGDVSLGEVMRGERQQIVKLVEAVKAKYAA